MSEVVYRACVRNIKELKKHRHQLNRLVTKALKENDDVIIETYTKLYALLYSAYAEVSFLKLIHEPNAFSDSEIDVIMRQRNLEDKWEKCIELSLIKITNDVNRGVINNKKRTIDRILEEYIIKPSQIRNKVAHGQWIECLNNDCTNTNTDATTSMSEIKML